MYWPRAFSIPCELLSKDNQLITWIVNLMGIMFHIILLLDV